MKTQYLQPQTLVVLVCPDIMKVPAGGGSNIPPQPAAPGRGDGPSVKLTKMYI